MGLLLLTSVGGQGEPAEARRAGVDAYLTKPIRQAQLVDCLVGMLGRVDHAGARPTAATPAEHPASSRALAILVVDDNVVNRAVIVGMLESYECVTAEAAQRPRGGRPR